MKFGNQEIFRLLFILAPLMLYFIYRLVTIFINLRKFLDKKTTEKVLYPVSYAQAGVKYVLLLLALLLILISAARPLGKPIESEQEQNGIDIMLVLDVSSSMFAIDLSPNRMEVVKQGVRDFIGSLSGDRVGMIVFAGVDFVQCPLTTDYEALDLIMDGVNPGMMPKEGTAMGSAIKDAVDRIEEKAEKSRIMILITDGESLEGMSPIEAAKIAKEKGIRIYTIGVGTEAGGKIPEGQDMFGRTYFKAYNGQMVVSRLDDTVLKQVAGITDGKYYRVTDRGAFAAINRDIKQMEDNKTKVKKNTQYEENYTAFLYWGILLFILSHLIPVRAINIKFDFIRKYFRR
jgi:Ca-activated chloride channel family protein